MQNKNLNPKNWKSIVMYFVPVLVLVLANMFQITDTVALEQMVNEITGAVITAIAGILAVIGIIKNNDKDKKK